MEKKLPQQPPHFCDTAWRSRGKVKGSSEGGHFLKALTPAQLLHQQKKEELRLKGRVSTPDLFYRETRKRLYLG